MTGIESIMSTDVVTVDASATVQSAAELMRERNLGALVVTKAGKIHGMFSERDLLNRVVAVGKDTRATSVDEVCTLDPTSVTAEAGVDICYQLIRDKGFRHLPIRNDDNEPVGIVSSRDFLRCLMVHVEADVSLIDTCAKLGRLTKLMESLDELP